MAGMAFFDFSLDQLKTYRPDREEPADFDAFWQRTLAEALADGGPTFVDIVSESQLTETPPVHAWLEAVAQGGGDK